MPPGTKLFVAILACFLNSATFCAAEQTDIHQLFEDRCLSCHGHSGNFAREYLTLENGEVLGRRGQPLDQFLSHHRGGLTPDEIHRLLDMFQKQINSEAFFQQRCGTCHDSAREFARRNLIVRDGVLFGRYSGRAIASFLPGHGRLDDAGALEMSRTLKAILLGGR